MANDKTEKATPKRREEARGRGQVARSVEVNSAAVLLAAVAALAITGPAMLDRLEQTVTEGLGRAGDTSLVDRGGIGVVVEWALRETALALAPVLLAVVVAGVVANVAQVGFRITPKALAPSFKKMNPLAGLKRMVGKDMLVETVKSLLKVAAVGAATTWALVPRMGELGALVGLPPPALLAELGHAVLSMAERALLAFSFIAVADVLYQRIKHSRSLRMTKEETKQEVKQADLPPEVRAAIRRRQTALARRRMLADVPTATVVVVNPTHVAVALRYDGSAPAPLVVAKGADLLAAAIRRAAEEHGVPVVHNAPLARTLHREVELGQMIPEGLFAAVAEVLAFVLRAARRRALPIGSRPSPGGR